MYQEILKDIQSLAKNRKITVVAVSKLQSTEKIKDLAKLGQIDFGENYIQEAEEKLAHFQMQKNWHWHFIGSLQKNKVKYLKNHFFMIHSVDSLELAELISRKSQEIGHQQSILLQVNLAGEDSKSGFTLAELEKNWPTLEALTSVKICGLMTMPPLQNEAEQNRIYFRQLKTELARLQKVSTHQHPLNELSMGTSSDYKVAIEEGATIVRLGTILFGERAKK